MAQVPDPPVCDRHWEAFLHRERLAIGWCIDCQAYGALQTASPCGHRFEPFVGPARAHGTPGTPSPPARSHGQERGEGPISSTADGGSPRKWSHDWRHKWS